MCTLLSFANFSKNANHVFVSLLTDPLSVVSFAWGDGASQQRSLRRTTSTVDVSRTQEPTTTKTKTLKPFD
jgi:hypothetical protein